MANNSQRVAVKPLHCSLKLTVCAYKREKGKTCLAGSEKAATHIGRVLSCCGPSGCCGFVSSVLQPSQSSRVGPGGPSVKVARAQCKGSPDGAL